MSGSGARTPIRLRFLLVLVIVSAASAGLCFGFSQTLGITLGAVALALYAAMMVAAVRQGRKRRAAGHRPDLDHLERRMRRRAKRATIGVALVAVSSGVALATRKPGVPAWPFVAGPVLLLLGTAMLWLMAYVLIPRARAKQAARLGQQ